MDKELNLLPIDLLSEMEMDTELSHHYEDDENEIIDDIAYHSKPNQINSSINLKTRLMSDGNILQTAPIQQQQQLYLSNQIQIFNYGMMTQQVTLNDQYHQMINSRQIHYYPIQGYQIPFVKIQRKNTFQSNYGNMNLFQDQDTPIFINNCSMQQQQPPIDFNCPIKRRHTNGFQTKNISFNNALKSKGLTDISKQSFQSSNKISLNQFEIDEFKAYLKSLKCEVSEFLCSQKGARDMQKVLNKSPLHFKTILINALKDNMTKVMIDIYGNYFCQQMIQKSTKEQIILILNYIKRDYVKIAKDYSGTHVLQAILNKVSSKEEQCIILEAIKGSEIDLAYDNNGTHVLQKIIVTINEELRMISNVSILNHLKELSLNSNGICLVKKFIGANNLIENKQRIIKIISDNCLEIAQNPFGNYAIQYLLESWNLNEFPSIIDILISNIAMLSIQKFSSNVSEKVIEYVPQCKRNALFNELFNPIHLKSIIKSKYGQYVLKKAVKSMFSQEKEEMKVLLGQFKLSSNKEKNCLKSFLSCLRS